MSTKANRRQRHWALAGGTALVCALVAGAWTLAAARSGSDVSASRPYWIVLASTRDGVGDAELGWERRTYGLRPDGSRLTSLLTARSLNPLHVSADGQAIAYGAGEFPTSVWVSRADGTGLRRVAHTRGRRTIDGAVLSPDGEELAYTSEEPDRHHRLFVVGADGSDRRELGAGKWPDWSPDGKRLVFTTGKGCGVAEEPFGTGAQGLVLGRCGSPKWSPDGSAIVFESGDRCAVVTGPPSHSGRLDQMLGSGGRTDLPGTCDLPQWSPDGRWIAFEATGCPYCESERARLAALKDVGVWVVRPSGADLHRVAPADEEEGAAFSWAPDSRRLAVAEGSRFFVGRVDGRARRLRLGIEASYESASPPLWSPDGKRIMVVGQAGDDPDQIWSARPDGHGLRRLTSAGVNDLVGVARLAPARAPALPVPASERVLGPATLATSSPIGLLSADGARVAYTAGTTNADCEHASIWTPAKRSILRASRRLPAPCEDGGTVPYTVYEFALAGSFIGWSEIVGCGNSCDTQFLTAALPDADPILAGEDEGGGGGADGGALTSYGPVGHGNLFVFGDAVRVATGGTARGCRLRGTEGVASIDGRLIAAYEPTGAIGVFDDRCSRVSVLRLGSDVNAALLDGQQLVVSRSSLLEAYEVRSGALVVRRPLPVGFVLEDVSGGVALLRHGKKDLLLVRLGDGRSFTVTPCRGPVLGAIEAPGLYYSYATTDRGGRLVLMPRSELDRRLASGIDVQPRCLRSYARYPTGHGPAALASGDLNGDGRQDLVTANEEGGSVSVLLNGGDGTFPARRDYGTGGAPTSVAVGDLNGDSKPDLVTASSQRNRVSVLLNNGEGTFSAARRYRVGRGPVRVAIGDFDDDGKPDLIVVNADGNSVSVLRNRGDGSFDPKVDDPAGDRPSSIAIADVNGNGTLDLAIGHGVTGAVLVLLGSGHGTFRRGGTARVSEVRDIALGDLNGDGKPDLVAARDGCVTSVILNRGDGSFGRPSRVTPRDCPGSVAIGDLNEDGRLDLVTSGSEYPYPKPRRCSSTAAAARSRPVASTRPVRTTSTAARS